MRLPIAPSLSAQADRDRYLASLFAPARPSRRAVRALCFQCRIGARARSGARAAARRNPPAMVDRCSQRRTHGEASANPVAAALLAAIERHRLAASTLIDLIDARRFDLYDEPMASVADLETYAQEHIVGAVRSWRRKFWRRRSRGGRRARRHRLRLTGCCAPFRSMPRGGSSMCRCEILGAARGRRRRNYSPANRRAGLNAALAELRNLARRHLAAAASASRRCRPRRCRRFFRLRWCGRRSIVWSACDAFAPAELIGLAAAMADLARGAQSGAD